jgi:hypothetical protein
MPEPQAQTKNVGVTTVTPPPPKEMLDMIIMQLEGAMESTQAPGYVKEACGEFVESLRKWGRGE